MTAAVSRFQLLRGDFKGRTAPLRPPHARPESRFVDTCDRTGRCVKACPEGILVQGRGGFPTVDFSRGECTFCMECVKACRSGALSRREGQAPWAIKAVIDESCLSARGTSCRICGEECEPGAIRFRLAVGGIAHPIIDETRCTGCGACYARCPVRSVRMAEPTDPEERRMAQ